jgi:hypothetical protein
MRDPAGEIEPDADIRVAERIDRRGGHEEVARVIDRHDHDDEATQHVDGRQAIGPLIRGCIQDFLLSIPPRIIAAPTTCRQLTLREKPADAVRHPQLRHDEKGAELA